MHRLIASICFYPTLCWNLFLNGVLSRWDWWNHVDDHVLIGAYPFQRIVPKLQAEGVRAVVNTCEEYAGPIEAYEKAGIEQLHIPTVDFTPPSVTDIKRGVAFIEKHIANGNSVYVHCKAGRGRSATIVLCWLIEAKGMTPEQAQSLLLEKRPQVLKTVYRREVVQQFVDQMERC